MRRSRTLFAVLLSFSLLAAACGGDDDSSTPTTTAPAKQSVLTTTTAAPSGLDELNVAYFLEWPTANQVAQVEQTYDSVLGLTVNWIAFPSGNDMALAMESGDIDISYSQGLTPFANYVTSGADHVIVGVAVSYADADNCVAHPDYAVSQDNAASSLAGQAIYTPIGNVTHFKLLKMLEHLGVSLDDVSLIPSEGGPAAVAAFENGDVAMACAFGGAINTMLASGGNLVMTGSEQEALGIRVFDIISAPRSFAEEHGDVVTAFLQVTEDANAAYAADRASLETTIADAAGMDVAGSNSLLDAFTFLDRDSQLSEAWLGGTVQAAMKEQMDFFVAQGEIDTALDSYDGVVDTSYIEAVVGRGFGAANPKAPSDGDVTGAPAGEDSSDPIRMPIHNWSSQIAGAYIMAAILESAGANTELIPSDSTLVYTAMCEGDMELVHEVWESSFGPAFEERVAEGCVIDAVTHDTKTREEWWYPAHTADHCPGLPDWEALNDCAALFATPESGDKGSYLAGPVDWMKADQERVDGLNLDFVVNNAGTAGALWAALDASIANDEPIVMFNWTPNFTEVLYEGAFVEFPAFEPECNTDPSWGVNPDALYDCGNPAGAYLKIGVNSEFPAKWPNAYGVVQNINFQNSDLAEMALYVDLDGMEPEDAASAWLADHCDRWTGWSGADASACPEAPAAPTVEPLGSDLSMCRANWASGYVQAEIVRQVLQSAGYGVSDPSAMELGPATAYMTMASGECDFWANSWYPNHYSWYENELPDGSLVSEHVEAVDGLFQDSGVQGWLITKSWADAEGIVSMDQINDTPALYEALDTDGDGVGEILGCPEDWTCDDTQEQMIAFAGWDNLVQTKAGYDALFAEFVNRVRAGDPGVMYTWTPSSYVVEMVPGVDVYWLSIEEDSVLDDSNPLGMSGGESQSQGDGFRDAPADTCTQPCQLGWEAADIQVSARSDVLAGDPYLHNLLVQIRPSILDISILQVEQTNGDGSEAHVQELAAGWMADNADIVAGWREAASAG